MEYRYSFSLPLNSAQDWVGGQRHVPAALPPGKTRYSIVQEAGWAPGPVWTGLENLAPTCIWSPDRTSRSESLCRLSYPDPLSHMQPTHYPTTDTPRLSRRLGTSVNMCTCIYCVCIVCKVFCIVCKVFCIVCTVFCIVCTVFYIVCTVFFIVFFYVYLFLFVLSVLV